MTKQQLNQLATTCFHEKWSNRTQLKIIRVARTIADLAGTETISDKAIEEAVMWKKEATRTQQPNST
ncbi:magnesium chelatase subunit ChlI family protein [Rummeliibacillus suwonensis]|uniref:magnesium chelatase subunit ChlI family protein n=1 Tax=Rummeliibacillus suwonensis TaxID=1306154 RepID=UPI0035E3D2A5